jgi:hypothetical protein
MKQERKSHDRNVYMTYLPHVETDKTRKTIMRSPFLSKGLVAELTLFWATQSTF